MSGLWDPRGFRGLYLEDHGTSSEGVKGPAIRSIEVP